MTGKDAFEIPKTFGQVHVCNARAILLACSGKFVKKVRKINETRKSVSFRPNKSLRSTVLIYNIPEYVLYELI